MTENTENKNIAELVDFSVQSQSNSDSAIYIGGGGLLSNMVNNGELAPRWWSRGRDDYLFQFAMRSNYFLSAQYKVNSKLCAISPRVLPRNPNIKQHQVSAEEYQQKLIEGSDFGQGWQSLFNKVLFDYFVQDNGAFMEVIGPGPKDKAIQGAPLGLAPLDASRCTRSGDWEYPVIYNANDGKYKLHWTRVIAISSNPPNKADMNGVGICWLSRCLDVAQSLLDMIIYKQEKLGSRPLRQILIGQGITASQIAGAIKMAENSMDGAGLNNYAKTIVMGSNNTDINLEQIDLAGTPDGFDFQTDLEMGMFAIAMAGGIPPRDLWPATTTGATKADAMYQHVGGSTGYSSILDAFANAIGGNPNTSQSKYAKFLPPYLKLVFDYVDDTQDEASAIISDKRSQTRERDINNSVITVQIARQQMLEDGEISQGQYDALELTSGRLPDGTPVLRLFNTTDEFILDLLNLNIAEPLNIEANIANREQVLGNISERIRYAEMIVINTSRASQRQKAEQAIAALGELQKIYQSAVDNQAVEEANEDTEQDIDTKAKSFKPPASVAREAQRALNWRDQHGDRVRGGTAVGWTRANQLAKRENISLDTIGRMVSFFARHEGNQTVSPENREEPWRDAGRVAWLIWGGDAGKAWANRIWQRERKEKQANGGEDLPPEIDDYEQDVIDLIEAANEGEITQDEFEEQLETLTATSIALVFILGTGVDSVDDLDDSQREALGVEIEEGTQTIPTLAASVFAGDYQPVEDGGKGYNIVAKAMLWAVFLAGVYELGKLYNDSRNPYLEWNITPGKDSCTDCLRLNGQVHRRSDWQASGWIPKRRRLECNGYNCGCYFVEVDGPERGNF